MKPVLRQIAATPEHSFLVRKDTGDKMLNNWHYHPEIELLYIKKSTGTWLIGDHIGHFKSGDVVMIGPGLPHCFRHEYGYTLQNKKAQGEAICVKFVPFIFGDHFLNLPETKEINKLLHHCSSGLKLTGKTRDAAATTIEKMLSETPGKKLTQLLCLLENIACTKQYTPLASRGFIQLPGDADKQRIKLVFEYTFNHFDGKIAISEVASLINMTSPSFCRYFKSKTSKTYVRFLMEVRIGHACRLLVEDEKNVAEISYACGYNNVSHFNHQFKLIKGKRPLAYKSDHLKTEAVADV